jgi:hypothetical protein
VTRTSPICPINPPGHDWQNSLTCRWCDATRTPGQAIVSGLASRRGGTEGSAQALLDADRANLLHQAAESVEAIHQNCHRNRDVCAGCQVRADILDVLRSVATAIAQPARRPAPTE